MAPAKRTEQLVAKRFEVRLNNSPVPHVPPVAGKYSY